MIWYGLRDTSRFEMGRVATDVNAGKKYLTVVTNVRLKNMKAPWVDSTANRAPAQRNLRWKTIREHYIPRLKYSAR